MDRNEKRRLRERIGEHLDVSKAKLTDEEAVFLADEVINNYEQKYRGKSESRQRTHDGWSSDGRYIRTEEFTDTFTDEVGILQDYSYRDDDGQSGRTSVVIRDARGILDWFKEHR